MISEYIKNRTVFNKKTQQMFLLFMLFATLISSATVICYILFFPDKTVEITLNNAIEKNIERESIIKNYIENSKQLLHTFANSKAFNEYINSKTNSHEIQRLFLIFSKSQKDFMQIRYIDKDGIEKIRVDKDQKTGKSRLVHSDNLQDKCKRDYFENSKTKPLGKVWFTAIDLNVEHKKVEVPYNPTFRAVLPVSKDGKFNGIIIVNYFMEDFLKKLLNISLYDAVLVNENGYPLIDYKKDKSWGFYQNPKFSISKQFPHKYKKILSHDVFKAENFASRRFDVPVEGGLILILKLKNSYVNAVKNSEYFRYISLFVITFLFSILFSFVIVRKFSDVLIKLRDKNNALRKELYFDSLTRLKNRKSLLKDIRKSNATCLILIDIQAFNKINDLYGGKAGDIVLQKFKAFLKKSTKRYKKIHLYRHFGNTFALVSHVKKDERGYIKLASELIESLESHDFSFLYDGVVLDFVVDARIGLAMASKCDNLMESADMALNYAKRVGKDIVSYDKSLLIEQIYENDMSIINTIKKALAEDRVVPYFQLIHKKDKIFYESLVRIVQNDGTVLSPAQFLDVAKRTRLYFAITKRMIEKSFKTFENTNYEFSINLSYLDIKNAETIRFLKKMLKIYNISNQLVIEIVESDTFKNYEVVKSFLDGVRELGIRVAIDDFGSGYSNFYHLIELNPDYIKVDGSLIKDIDINEKSFTVAKTIATFGKDMNMEVIAEFIHSKSVYEKAQSLEIDGYQGYLLGKPKSAEEIFKDNALD